MARRDDKLVSIVGTISNTLGALASGDASSIAGPVFTHPVHLIKGDFFAAWQALAADAEGPLLVGIAHASMTAAEIEEYLEITGPLSPEDNAAMEKASRGKFIRILGIIGQETDRASGEPFREFRDVKLNLSIRDDDKGFVWWTYNMDHSNPLTTGSEISVNYEILGRWLL